MRRRSDAPDVKLPGGHAVRPLTYATVCSGVECMGAAVADLPMRPVFFAEIEPFPCAVLRHRYPNVPNLGDMCRISVSQDGKEVTNGTDRILLGSRLDVLAGGTPCQDVSSAGLRRGMSEGSGTRSSLAFEFVRLVRELRPRYVLWENVAGVLSDPSFPGFLSSLAECGYGLAYRTLDAQWTRCADVHHPDGGVVRLERAVPQRRRRVWVVGCAGGDVRRASEVLFEREGLAGDRPPRRVSGQGASIPSSAGDGVAARMVGAAGFDPFEPGGVKSVNAGHAGTVINGTCPGQHGAVVLSFENHAAGAHVSEADAAPTMGATRNANALNNNPLVVASGVPFVKVSHARGRDGEGERLERGELAGTRNAVEGGDGRSQECVVLTNSNGEDVSPTLSRDCRSTGDQLAKNGGYVLERLVPCRVRKGAETSAAYGMNPQGGKEFLPFHEECGETLAVRHGGGVCLSRGRRTQFRSSSFGAFVRDSVSGTLDTSHMGTVANGMPCVSVDMDIASMRYVVRRLTPTECERLMGLPDGWTLPAFAPSEITDALVEEFRRIHDTFGAVMAAYAGRPAPRPKTAAWVRRWLERISDPATCPDAPRYKACGNGWATNQPRWIILRILFFEGIDPWNPEETTEPIETRGIAA